MKINGLWQSGKGGKAEGTGEFPARELAGKSFGETPLKGVSRLSRPLSRFWHPTKKESLVSLIGKLCTASTKS